MCGGFLVLRGVGDRCRIMINLAVYSRSVLVPGSVLGFLYCFSLLGYGLSGYWTIIEYFMKASILLYTISFTFYSRTIYG